VTTDTGRLDKAGRFVFADGFVVAPLQTANKKYPIRTEASTLTVRIWIA